LRAGLGEAGADPLHDYGELELGERAKPVVVDPMAALKHAISCKIRQRSSAR
jgi:hypothetical protein